MKKHRILLVLVAMSIIAFTSCSKQEVAWQTINYDWVDGDGIDYKATLKVTPWINTKNVGYIDAAWSEVGKDNKLPAPTPEGWGLKFTGTTDGSSGWGRVFDGYEGDFQYDLKEISNAYYCIGEISVESLGDDSAWISPCITSNKERRACTSTVSKVFEGDQATEMTWAKISPSQNTIPFVFVHFDDIDGSFMSEITDTSFGINGSDYHIWRKGVAKLATLKLSIVE